MRVFVTGATGFVGSAVVADLQAAGHQVLGLARSDAAATALMAAGAEVHRGDLEDLDSLRRGAMASEGVVHTGFIHDFSRFKEVCEVDSRAIAALGSAVLGTGKRLVVTAGVAFVASGRLATEVDAGPQVSDAYPRMSEQAVATLVAEGGNVSVVRLAPSVHGAGDHGFVSFLIAIARAKGVSAYIGDGSNRWSAVPRLDAARLFRLAVETGEAGATYHGIAEEGIPFRAIAEAIGRGLGLPVVGKTVDEAGDQFDWFAGFATLDCPASSAITQQVLDWQPTGVGLLEEIGAGHYFRVDGDALPS
ncbi:MAG: 3-beta hydroxysteroid dehydrogenase [Pseudorhodobacter sp. PARRP1]|nr:MAG: 3-beta hydroxysteroid dehydrogenase [Pseudorhodobacter sp. PARRP1]